MGPLRLTIHLTRWYLLPLSTDWNEWSGRTYAWLCFTLDTASPGCERWL